MAAIGDGDWDSGLLQDPRWRKLIEQLAERSRPPAERLRLAKKLLRDGNDLACCMLFAIYRAEAPQRGWGSANPLDPALGAMRFRALRILGTPSRLQGRDHRAAAQLLPWIAKARDRTLFARLLQAHPDDPRLLQPALEAIARLAPELAQEPDDPDGLYPLLVGLSDHAALSADDHQRVADALAAWPAPDRLDTLHAAASREALGPSARWPYLRALHALAPERAAPLLRALRDTLGRGHLLHDEIHQTLQPSV